MNPYLNEEWKIPNFEIVIYYNHLLGEGQYGKVYLGKWRTLFVALKMFDSMNDLQLKELLNEFNILTKLHHPNIIQLLGYVEDPFIIVMEYFPLGNLQQFLHNNPYISYHHRIDLCLSIAKGIYYLHHRKPTSIIHRDLKPSNLLIENGLNVKISDFGMSKILSSRFNISRSSNDFLSIQYIEKSGISGTLSYMAPEMLDQSCKSYTQNIDIYSFGIIIYEIFAMNRITNIFSSKESFLEAVKHGFLPHFPCFFPNPIKSLIIQCIQKNQSKRPSIELIVSILENIKLKHFNNFIWNIGFFSLPFYSKSHHL